MSRPNHQLGQASPDTRTGIAAGLAVGLASAAVLGVGVILFYLLFRRDQHQHQLGAASPQPLHLTLGYPQVPDQTALWSPPTQVPVAVNKVSPKILGSGPTMSTLSVPVSRPVWVASAASVPSRVTIAPVAPTAGFVVLAYRQSALDGATLNQSNGFIVPVGQDRTLRLLPGQQLFARGIAPPGETLVLVSVARADAPGDV